MISVTVLTKNSAKTLAKVLNSLKSFDEVLVYDTGSTDETVAIANTFTNARVIKAPFEGFGKTHNHASSKTKHSWVLSVDSDEVLSDELIHEIQTLKLDTSTVYRVRRKNFYKGEWIWSCGWYPDSVVRLYHKEKTKFSDDEVHEKVLCNGLEVQLLKGHLHHYPFSGSEDFLRKMQHYSTLFAEQNRGKRTSGFFKALFRGTFTFVKSYLIKRGALQGARGFEIAFYNGATTFYKYLKLSEV